MFSIRTRPSLQRDFALLSMFIGFVFVLVSVWVTYETYEEHSDRIVKLLENESVRIDRALIIEIENASYLVESVGRQIASFPNKSPKAIAQLFASFSKEGQNKSLGFSWIDKDQHLIVASALGGIVDKPIDVSDRDYVKKAITQPWTIHIGRPVESRATGKWIIPIGMGLTGANGEMEGIAVTSLEIERLTQKISSVIKQPGISYAITNSALTLLTEVSDIQNFFNNYFDIAELSKLNFEKDPNGVYSLASLLNSKRIFSYYEHSSEYPYIILVGYDAKLSSGSIRATLVPKIIQLSVIAAFMVLILWMVRRRIIQPVINITRAAQLLIRGDKVDFGNMTAPIEIEQLAGEISHLSEYIAERRRIEQELRHKNTELNKIKAAAQLTNEVKAQFFEYVGSELTQPVHAIMENAESLADQHFGAIQNEKYLHNANDIRQQAFFLQQMLEDIRAISAAETGLIALDESNIELPFILNKCVRIYKERHTGQSPQIVLELPEILPKLYADELRLKQLILNILFSCSHSLNDEDLLRISALLQRNGLALQFETVTRSSSKSISEPRLGNWPPSAAQSASKKDAPPSRALSLAMARLLVGMHEGQLEVKTTADHTHVITVLFPTKRLIVA